LLEIFAPAERLKKVLEYLPSAGVEIRREGEEFVVRVGSRSTPHEITSTVQAYLGGWGAHDINRILESVTEDFVFDERPMTMTEPLQGKQKFQEYLTNLFAAFPDLAKTETNVVVGENQAWAEWVISGTHQGEFLSIPPTGRQIIVRGASAFQVREGKVAHERLYWDAGHLLRQLGKLS
jgi:steroid delta-isomerase-like uncharacterized protein